MNFRIVFYAFARYNTLGMKLRVRTNVILSRLVSDIIHAREMDAILQGPESGSIAPTIID